MLRTTRGSSRLKAPSRNYGLSQEAVVGSVNDRVWQGFRPTMTPSEVANVLRGAINGDPLAQHNLFDNMIGTWPDLGKALLEISDEAAMAPLNVVAYAPDGEEPSPSALDKAAAIRGLKKSMRPQANTRREGWGGTVREMALGYFYGITVREIYWGGLSKEGQFPVSTEELNPVYYRYPIHGNQADKLLFSPNGRSGMELYEFDTKKFLVGEKRLHRGGILTTAPLRVLVPFWLAATYGLKWFMQYGQIFGVPFRLGKYKQDDDKARVALSQALESLGASGWAAAPDGTDIDVVTGGQSGQSLPQKALIDMANAAANKFILGQTLTSDVSDSGSRALGDVHESVKRNRVKSVVSFVADILNNQLVPAVIRRNWGDELELPHIEADWSDEEDALKKVERDEKLFGTMGLPVAKKDLYERHGVRMPEDDEEQYSPRSAAAADQESAPDGKGFPSRAQSSGPEPGQAPTSQEDEPDMAQAQRVQAAATLNTATLDALQGNVAKMVPDVAQEWLESAEGLFAGLVARALDGSTSPAEFERVVAEAAALVPGLQLNSGSLEEALANAVGTAMLAGAGQKALDLPATITG
jgi:phage gp29-like protein